MRIVGGVVHPRKLPTSSECIVTLKNVKGKHSSKYPIGQDTWVEYVNIHKEPKNQPRSGEFARIVMRCLAKERILHTVTFLAKHTIKSDRNV